MKVRISILLFSMGLGFVFSLSAASQLVGSVPCESEKVQANFFMEAATGFSGTVLDRSGAAIPGVTLEIRSASGRKVLQSAAADERGKFEFARIAAGRYRLVPVRMADGKAARFPGFDPPESLHCQASARCELRVVLPVRPTDLPYTFCPPR